MGSHAEDLGLKLPGVDPPIQSEVSIWGFLDICSMMARLVDFVSALGNVKILGTVTFKQVCSDYIII